MIVGHSTTRLATLQPQHYSRLATLQPQDYPRLATLQPHSFCFSLFLSFVVLCFFFSFLHLLACVQLILPTALNQAACRGGCRMSRMLADGRCRMSLQDVTHHMQPLDHTHSITRKLGRSLSGLASHIVLSLLVVSRIRPV